ncbi:long-chain fatty acid--CoA ligase [Mycobacterium shimoidei]|uniref:Long-chain-fatty-acid--CoA ligase FadD13 n=1 Tax=Mycobacterium shimoidei TaxID=29313 RepID=A0A1E3T527_MYCSH|nr:long-chain fatty acid--CoA ligase [Mycobacterium shimoidei]MCV7259673.1 long-chain fatty acid--CoA ligase [Mycobacterium shimoidei]ODR09586.1 long-chain fatty acid--CoA ligase [Mycobacterium shimoidei]ORW76632.1 long-chain fatty acid--CoA ligase [Mycobacterium shimoidei]SRX93940.1 putative medium chain fatty-acid-CoA ligase FadD14 (fatty-acid-CoA synthetase) (fatty-acid-CoA synthase) [Mycobacterium tuberculosis H37Rv] [Mycobacterium shimoidei]
MYATMQNVPLTITAILRHATVVHGARRVTTATGSGYRQCSYAELGAQAAQLANALRRLGIIGDQRVATFMWNNAEHLATYLAVPSMGAVLHTLNIRLFADQIVFVANEAEDQVVLVDMSLADLLAPVLGRLDSVHTVIAVGDGDLAPLSESGKTVLRFADVVAGEPREFDWPEIDENSAAAMCYTSGTTGHPKGVVYSHRSSYLHTMATCTSNGIGIGASDCVLPIVPMFHANAWGLPYAALMAGADLVLPDRHLDAESLVGLIETQRPTVAGAVPTIWNDILHYLEREPDHDVSSLRLVASGGSAVPESLMRTFQEKHGVQIRQLWGMTETSPLATMAWPPPGTPDDQYWALRATQGRPVCGVEARIVDDDDNVLPNDGVAVGELEVRGPWITGSYYGGADESRFQSGWLRTGDVGRIDERGFITLTDRAKDVIKSGGEWISSVELENCLIAHPDVVEAAVVGVPDERWQERPLAVVVGKKDGCVDASELRKYLSDKVARWWLPERWTFVDEIPRTSVGKYDKKAIRSRYAENAYQVTEVRD